ncbi:MAG: citrate lyase acyl carrier protein [Angelakisella sp.]|nr:citrate lyase acyl carrier protein [Angelakisella sp.]
MKIKDKAFAGTLESSDIFIQVFPGSNGLELQLDSIVMAQYGNALRQAIEETLQEFDVKDVCIIAQDRGALDCTVKARLETALKRAERGTEQ